MHYCATNIDRNLYVNAQHNLKDIDNKHTCAPMKQCNIYLREMDLEELMYT